MESKSKRATTSSARYTFSDGEEALESTSEAPKNGRKKKRVVKPKTAVCKICHKKYTDRSCLLRHMELHRDTLDYSCDICDARFKTSRYLDRHQKRVHAPATHECDYCGKRFTLANKLDQHRLIHTGEKPHKCEVCGKRFRATYSLNTHRYLHTNEKPYKCLYCPYACRDNSTLRRHHERHTSNVVYYQCSDCGKKYTTKSKLKSHVLEHHIATATELKMVACPKCPVKFKSNATLNRHIRMVHDKVFKAKCEVCGVEISNKYNMSSHLRAHLHVRPYKCRHKPCTRRFKDMPSLKRHSKIHKPHEQHACDECGRLFARRHRLNVHMKTHGDDSKWNTRFKVVVCDHCGFSYDNKPRLVRHMLKHIRHRNTYACDVCKYVTHRKLSIEKHMKYGHGDEDDVHCKICNKSYKLHAYLILHYYNRHGVRYKTVKSIKMETSVTIKEEPQEPIPDAEVDLEEIQKQEPLADIITDVALDCDATDILYSKSVLSEDIRRSASGQVTTTPTRFRKRLRGRAAWFDEQNTIYARKEKDVKKRIKKMLTRVRQKKWTRVLEEARQQYNDRIRAITQKENNLKIKPMNIAPGNNKKTDTNQLQIDLNTNNIDTKSSNANDKELDRERDTNDEAAAFCDETNEPIVNDNKSDSEVVDNESVDDASLINDDEINKNGDVANVYEDVFDVEENPIGKVIDNLNEIDIRIDCNATDNNLNEIDTDNNKIDNPRVDLTESEIRHIEDINLNEDNDKTIVPNENNIVDVENKEINDNGINKMESSDSNEQYNRNGIDKDIDRVSKSNLDGDREYAEGKRGRNVKLKINTHQCYICYKLYKTKKELLDHCQVHFDVCSDIPLKKCPLCNYVTKLTITRHIKLVHGINITLPYHLNVKNKNSKDSSRYVYNINDKVVKEIEIIPSVRNLNKIAYVKIDKNNKINKDMSVAKTKLVKKSGEWIVEHENINLNKINNEFILPEFDKKEIKRLKYVGDQYLDIIKALGRLATRHKAQMLYPCNGCDKLCRTFAALKLHSRRHEADPKPFKKKVWKHKSNEIKKKSFNIVSTRKMEATERVREADPRPIENKHRCDKTLMDFYEKNVKGADIEFWQFLKIYNRMSKDHGGSLQNLTETNEFGDYTTEETTANETIVSENTDVVDNTNRGISGPKVRSGIRKPILSKQERLRRAQIKEQLRRKLSEQ